jgi:TPR repeat protein
LIGIRYNFKIEIKRKTKMKKILVILFLLSGLLYADSFDDGMQAYKNGNYKKAARLLQKPAEQGNAEAQASLGFMYEFGEGVRKDDQKAIYWYKKAAEQGNADAEFSLGNSYLDGERVRQDCQKGIKLLTKAAKQGHIQAILSLGRMYWHGLRVRQNKSLAKEYFGKACDLGIQDACDYYKTLNQEGY